ncbi:MAG: 2-amino-4-hydroxy-6-hydroxymethyldihydropteridine diphosphokinase [Proteobacteria bacterium]|nr:2-amino-4-hydroxy-6-hydroxymethyldihydropteridine diphosphokinase [Pseudomonadota bacterium]
MSHSCVKKPHYNAFIALGASIGSTSEMIARFRAVVDDMSSVGKIQRVSDMYLNHPQGGVAQNLFLNAVCHWQSSFDPYKQLSYLLALEQHYGRKRQKRLDDRMLDLDILYISSSSPHSHITQDTLHTTPYESSHPELCVPHPRLTKRAFMWHPFKDLFLKWQPLSQADQCLYEKLSTKAQTSLATYDSHPSHPSSWYIKKHKW